MSILPKLAVIRDDVQLEAQTCQGKDNCSTCTLFQKNGGRCGGCSPKHKANLTENFKWCYQQCNTCTGYEVSVTAICCRSPLKDVYLNQLAGPDWNKPKFNYTRRRMIELNQRAIFYISSGGIRGVARDNHIVENHEVVAVNVTQVWSGKGFYSHDLHDYLHLPKKTKLLLLMMSKDDILERFWDKSAYAEPEKLESVGIKYWMPVAFSAYRNEANMHQYYQFLRCMRTAEAGKAWFTPGVYLRPNIKLDDLFKEAVAKMPQIMFNAQFNVDDALLRQQLIEAKWWDNFCPPEVAFWYVGSATPRFMHNLRKVVGPSRPLYFVSSNVLMSGVKGKRLKISGKVVKDREASRLDLVRENYATFANMVKEYG